MLTHKVLTTSTPPYLHDILTVAVAAPARPMRSAGAPLLFVLCVRTELARRAFSVAGPTVFNSLPLKIRLSHSIDIFQRHLKILRRPSLSATKRLCIQGHYKRYKNALIISSYLILYEELMCFADAGRSNAAALRSQKWTRPSGWPAAGQRSSSDGKNEERTESTAHGDPGRPFGLCAPVAVTSRRYQWRHRCMCSYHAASSFSFRSSIVWTKIKMPVGVSRKNGGSQIRIRLRSWFLKFYLLRFIVSFPFENPC